ncbi:hypothetical protein ACFYOV_32950 [Streptomyces sp. NPDC005931]|uniref:hypothetical protein n=1 Tax=Streptomyces sp. NPDC005931 TaxID=3364737 RepID=UPI0036AF2365
MRTVSQILARLTALGWVTFRQEEGPHPGRPARVFHSMSSQGRHQAKAALAARQARGPCRTPAPVMFQTPPAPAPRPVGPAGDSAADQKPISEQAAHHTPDEQRTAGEPGTPPAQPMPKLAGYWPIRWPSAEALRRLTAASSPEALTEAARTGANTPLNADDIPQHLAPLTDALAALDTVKQSLTKDVFARAAACPTHTEHYEKLIRAIVMKSNDLRRTTLRAPRTRSARSHGGWPIHAICVWFIRDPPRSRPRHRRGRPSSHRGRTDRVLRSWGDGPDDQFKHGFD